MKALKIVLIALLGLIILFFLTGIFIPNVQYSNTVQINASPEVCWKALNDTSAMKTWMEGFKSMELKAGNPMEVGSVYEIVIDQGEVMIMQEELKELRENEYIAFSLTNDVLKSEYSYTITPSGSGVTITSQHNVTGNNILWKSLFAFSSSYFSESDLKMLNALKGSVEN